MKYLYIYLSNLLLYRYICNIKQHSFHEVVKKLMPIFSTQY